MSAKKAALGRGLSAILETPESEVTEKDVDTGKYLAGAIASISVKNIEGNPYQPRQDFDIDTLQELAESITRQGIIQPVTVRKLTTGRYQLISGERRLRAARIAGLQTIPAYIRIAKDNQMLEMALVENIQRDDLNPVEVAISYQRLMEECGLTQEKLSEQVGKKRATIANYVRLLKLPAEIQIALRDSRITMGHARALISIEDEELQLSILNQIIDDGLSVRDVEEMTRESTSPEEHRKSVRKPARVLPEHLLLLKKELSEKFDARVELRRNLKGQGSVVIPFRSDEDLERIIKLLKKD